jgi:hypothetical protein
MSDDIVARLREKPDRICAEAADEIERLRASLPRAGDEALDRYRYAIDWVASDSWDHCSDCRSRLAWARALDGARLTADELAAIGQQYLKSERLTSEPPRTGAKLTPPQVRAILADPRASAEIAKDYPVAAATIRTIKTGRSWRKIT